MLPPAGKSPFLMTEEGELSPARLGPPVLVVSFYLGSPPASSLDLFLFTQPPVESLSVPKSDTLGNLAPPHPITLHPAWHWDHPISHCTMWVCLNSGSARLIWIFWPSPVITPMLPVELMIWAVFPAWRQIISGLSAFSPHSVHTLLGPWPFPLIQDFFTGNTMVTWFWRNSSFPFWIHLIQMKWTPHFPSPPSYPVSRGWSGALGWASQSI